MEMNKKRKIILSIVLIFLLTAYLTKPDNKTIIIASVTRVWADRTPSVYMRDYYNQFMDLNSKQVDIEDWLFAKRIKYQFGANYHTIGIAGFKNILFFIKNPYGFHTNIPKFNRNNIK